MEGDMTRRTEEPPALVPQAQQAGEVTRHRMWTIAKPCVWTVRMLTTLITGVEGGKWFRLFDKVFSERNLLTALQQVARNDGAPGVDHVSVFEFVRQAPENLWQLSDALKDGTYRPQAIRRVHIPKPGTNETRPLEIASSRRRW
jgi:RNA-directed DNA polymerase